MIILTIIFAVLFIFAIIYIIKLKTQQKKLFFNLNKVFNDALNNDVNKISYDESIASALDDKIIRYINANKDFLKNSESEHNSIKVLISDISHQINTPLANLILYSELLSEKEIADDSIKQMISDIKQQSEKLKFLLDMLIKTSRLETGIITVNNTKNQPVKPLISAAVSEIYPFVIKQNITLSVDIDSEISAAFDMKWTKEAIYNILDNAVKYTKNGGDIKINVISYEMFIRIDIIDTGIGINSAEYTEIFKRFYRSPNVREYKGVGIGLYLSRKIIELQGGYIKVKSEINKGSIFSVFLPV
jgi:signal transduction histidine kinase